MSIATGYRYLHEAIDVIAAHAPDLHDVLAHAVHEQWAFVCLDGTLIPSTRCSAPSETGHDLWYSGSTHHITAARAHALPALRGVGVGGKWSGRGMHRGRYGDADQAQVLSA